MGGTCNETTREETHEPGCPGGPRRRDNLNQRAWPVTAMLLRGLKFGDSVAQSSFYPTEAQEVESLGFIYIY